MFKLLFVARVTPEQPSARCFCRFRPAEASEAVLPADQNLHAFCFPAGPETVKPKEYAAPEEYSFTLTGGDGSHLHGFCRSFLPPRAKLGPTDARRNANLRYPQVLCILSPFAWFPFYWKVLQVVEALLKQGDALTACRDEELPPGCPAARFLENLLRAAGGGKPQLGRVLRVPLPPTEGRVAVSPQRRVHGPEQPQLRPLRSTEREIELQIPPDTGNGAWNAGTPLARLFWHLPAASLLALLQALLLERRVLMVAQERDTLSAAVHAAAALLYPFRWQHIYLPLLPHKLKDYLTAPMPYLIGVPAPQLLAGFPLLSLEDVVWVDLDAGSCTAGGPGGPPLDYGLLPWGGQLHAAFQIVYQMLRSPTEFESTPVIGHCLQEYFLKLLGSYREYCEPDEPEEGEAAAAADGPGRPQQHLDDGYLRAHGWRFDHLSFVANQRRSEKARHFLDALRHSQLYEVFVTERLGAAATGFRSADAFEAKVAYLHARRSSALGRLVAQAGARGVSNLSAVLSRTSTLVKSGVAQIRHARNASGEEAEAQQPAGRREDVIVPSYTVDLDGAGSPPQGSPPQPPPAAAALTVPARGEDPASFFNLDPNAEDDAPLPPGSPTRAVSPIRSPTLLSPTARSSGGDWGAFGRSAFAASPGSTGPLAATASSPAEPGPGPAAPAHPSLLDDDAFFSPPAAGLSESADCGFGLPTVFAATASQESGRSAATSQEAGEQLAGLELSPAGPHPPAASGSGRQGPGPAWGVRNSLESIDPFQGFHSPEAQRASSSTGGAAPRPGLAALQPGEPRGFEQPLPDVSPVLPRGGGASGSGRRHSSERERPPGAGRQWPAACSGLEERSSSSAADAFALLDPTHRPASRTPMVPAAAKDGGLRDSGGGGFSWEASGAEPHAGSAEPGSTDALRPASSAPAQPAAEQQQRAAALPTSKSLLDL